MPRNGSGGYQPPSSSWNPAVNSNSATAADWNALLADLSAAIQGSVASDGETPMTGNLQMGNNKATGLAAATTLGDSLRMENLIAGADIASATTVTIPLEGNLFKITGTTAITGFAATRGGRAVYVTFGDILTLTNSATFSMPANADITTAAGDVAAFLYDGTNWICVGYRPKTPFSAPAFSAYQSTFQTTAGGGFEKVRFQTKEFDTNTCFDNTTNYRFTPNVAGYYQVNGSVQTTSAPIDEVEVSIFKNGVDFKRGIDNLSPANVNSATVSALIYLNGSTDYIELFVYTNTSVNIAALAPRTYFQAAMVRAA